MKINPSIKPLVLEAWDECDSLSVGATELINIRCQLELSLGKPVTESPARLARMLADEGIPLRHPEVLETDSKWREVQIEKLSLVEELDFETIESALESAGKIESVRVRFVADSDTEAERSLYEQVVEIKNDLAKSSSPVAIEAVEWLKIWLQNAQIFSDWLSLRRESSDFVRKFGS